MTFDPREDVIDTCNIADITFTNDNGDTVSINLTYEDDNEMDETDLPAFMVREPRPTKIPTTAGWTRYMRTIEFDVSFYVMDSDDVDPRSAKKQVMDEFETKIENNQENVTDADNVKIISARPQSDYDQKRNIFGVTWTLEAIDKD